MGQAFRLRRMAAIAAAQAWQGPAGVAVRPQACKDIDVEAFLAWCYRTELPKRPMLGAGPAGYGFGLPEEERVDNPSLNAWGLVPDLTARQWPHPDAVRCGNAVLAMRDWIAEAPEDWNPLADLAAAGYDVADSVDRALHAIAMLDERGQVRLRSTPETLIVKHALLGGCPEWEADMPEQKPVTHANGRPRWFRRILVRRPTISGGMIEVEEEVDGYDRRAQRPYPDAYRKTYLDPDPLLAAIGRAEYEVWHAALAVLVEELNGVLEAHRLLPSRRPPRPWEQASC